MFKKPIIGIAFCRAPAKSGYAAAPARTVMRFRRLIPSPSIRHWAWIMALQSHFWKAGRMATFHQLSRSPRLSRTGGMGQEEPFQMQTLSDREAPIPDLPGPALKREVRP
jgi:hypothetical protein